MYLLSNLDGHWHIEVRTIIKVRKIWRVLMTHHCKITWIWKKTITPTVWKLSKYGVFSVPYFPVFRLNTGITRKYGPEKPPYLDTFHAVSLLTRTVVANLGLQEIRKHQFNSNWIVWKYNDGVIAKTLHPSFAKGFVDQILTGGLTTDTN